MAPWNRLGTAEPMLTAGQKTGIEQPRDVLRLDWSVRDPLPVDDDLDERLEPIQTARTVANHIHRGSATTSLGANLIGDTVRAERSGGGVYRHEDFDAGPAHDDFRISSKRSGVTRPWTVSSTMMAGEHAQLPRQ